MDVRATARTKCIRIERKNIYIYVKREMRYMTMHIYYCKSTYIRAFIRDSVTWTYRFSRLHARALFRSYLREKRSKVYPDARRRERFTSARTAGDPFSFAARKTNSTGEVSIDLRTPSPSRRLYEPNAISSVKPNRVPVYPLPTVYYTPANNNISISRSFVFDDWRPCTPFQLTYDLCRMRIRSGTFQTLGP